MIEYILQTKGGHDKHWIDNVILGEEQGWSQGDARYKAVKWHEDGTEVRLIKRVTEETILETFEKKKI